MGIKSKIKKFISTYSSIKVEVNSVTNTLLLNDRTALVIGGSTRIGFRIVKSLKSAVYKVIVASRNKHDVDDFSFEQWDVTKTENIEQRFSEIIEKYGAVVIIDSGEYLK